MASKKPAKKDDVTDAARVAGLFSSTEFVELLHNRRKFAFLNFRAGLYRGVGGVIGAALAIVLLGYLVYLLGGVPLIGTFFRDIQNSVPSSQQTPKE